ncbi:hypothetical protein [Flammeovirga pacifica]|nr:hypothetical protein [Flammeovirga pacifica]
MKKLFLILMFIGITNLLNAQSIDFSSIRLNNSIPSIITLTELKSLNIKIDSIKAIPVEMDMATFDSIVYVGKTYFEYYKNIDKCVLSVVDFDQVSTELIIGKMKFNNTITISEVSKYFNLDCSSFKSARIYRNKATYKSCEIPISFKGEMTDSRMILFFLNEKLSRIDFSNDS